MSINITKDLANQYLKEFAKELRKETKKLDIDIIIVGGGSILLNYNFRYTTGDFDIIKPNKLISIKKSAYKIAEKYNLNDKWINDDFITTDSFSNKLLSHANYYRTFSNHIHFYTIKDEYLIAMKLVSARNYKNDYSDIVGILTENDNISFSDINKAIIDLYDDYEKIDINILNEIKEYINLPKDKLCQLYDSYIKMETSNANHLKIHESQNNNDNISFADKPKSRNIAVRMKDAKAKTSHQQYENNKTKNHNIER